MSEFSYVFEAQIAALQRTKDLITKQLDQALNILKGCKGKIVVTGIGKSGIIARKISSTLASTGSPSVYINANEALHGDLGILSKGDVVIMLSKSGTTTELIQMLPKIRSQAIRAIGIFGKTETRLAESLDMVIDASVEEEGSPFNLAPMASTTVALVIGDALAAGLMVAKGLNESDFAVNHPAGQLGRNLLLKVEDIMHEGIKMPVCTPVNTIKEAIVILTKNNLGGLCVVAENGEFEGFVTDGDIRKYLSSNDDLQKPISEIMTVNPVFALPEMTLGKLLQLMENPDKLIYVAPVLKPNTRQAIGIVRMHDILLEN